MAADHVPYNAILIYGKGGREKKMTYICQRCGKSDVHLPQRYKKSSYLLYFLFLFLFLFLFHRFCFKTFFGRFLTRGVQKHNFCFPPEKSIWLITKNTFFFRPFFFFFSLGCFVRFFLIAFLGVS
jgi:hypothetical protein